MAAWTDMKGSALGPLTTAWSMPDSCTVHVVNCPTCTEGFRGQQCTRASGTETGAQDHTSCWPPVTALAGTPKHPFVGWGFYSPGLACPTGYRPACTARYGDRPEWEIQFTLVPGETAIGCCPDGFQCTNRFGNTCMAIASTDAPIAVATGVCSGATITRVAQATFPDVVTATITDTTSNTLGPFGAVRTVTREMMLLAPMFQLNFKSSDLVSESTSSASTTTGTPPTTTTASLSTPLASTGRSDPNDNLNSSGTSDDASTTPNTTGQGGLSTGAVAGIGVGAALGGMLLMAVLGWLWWKRRQRRDTASIPALAEAPGNGHDMEYSHHHGSDPGTWGGAVHSPYKQELPFSGSYHQPPPHSAGPGPYGGGGVRHELGATLTPVELSTTERGRPGDAHSAY